MPLYYDGRINIPAILSVESGCRTGVVQPSKHISDFVGEGMPFTIRFATPCGSKVACIRLRAGFRISEHNLPILCWSCAGTALYLGRDFVINMPCLKRE
jgi:hypothetical protein